MGNKLKKMAKLALYVAVNVMTIGLTIGVIGGVLNGR